jgi:integrase
MGGLWMFPSLTLSTDPRSGVVRRHHLFEERLQRALKMAVMQAGIAKPVSVHSLRLQSGAVTCSFLPVRCHALHKFACARPQMWCRKT